MVSTSKASMDPMLGNNGQLGFGTYAEATQFGTRNIKIIQTISTIKSSIEDPIPIEWLAPSINFL